MKFKTWFKKSANITLEKKSGKIIVTNNSDVEEKIYGNKIIKCKREFVNVEFDAKTLTGSGSLLKLVNRSKVCKLDVVQGSKTSSMENMKGYLLPIIIIKPHTTIEINAVIVSTTLKPENTYNKFIGKKKILLLTPLYPSADNLYACGFVHTRVKEYQKNGIDVEVICVSDYNAMGHYVFDGIDVYRTGYTQLRAILMFRKYDAILVHFFDEKIAHYLETGYIKNTPVILWNHGADILYWDYKELYTPYFMNDFKITKEMTKAYKKRDEYVAKLANRENYYWIFVSNDEKQKAEEMHNIKFKNAIVIPNMINSEIFAYKDKNLNSRKNIFMIRRFDNTKKYAIDIAVLTILELSRRECFKELNFYICGEGNYFNELVLPIRKFENVHLIHNFLSHEQIKKYHDLCGIALFPTRQDTQGVSALEAASSGLAVVTSDLPVLHEYFDESLKTLCDVEDYKKYADVIERLYHNPEEFKNISIKMHENTEKICGMDNTIYREIEYINNAIIKPQDVIRKFDSIPDTPLLTIAIPSYNAEKFLNKCLQSLLQSEYANLTEILVINDGSKDGTKEIGKMYEELTTINGKSIVKLVDKENGGHGSGINKGIELARGKYFKVIDADDWVDENQYNELLKRLINEDADIVLTDYAEARTFEEKPFEVNYYESLIPGITYNFDDICLGQYGFKTWGPTLPTSTYKTECLRKANFKLLEKTFYVDMTYNAYSIIYINTVKKYDLNVYRYYIGNAGQSVSQEGMIKNYKHHENVIIELMKIVTRDDRLSAEKREYILRKLLLPMVYVQYYIELDLLHSRKKFLIFEKRTKEFPSLLGYHEFNIRNTKFHRYTKGIFVGINPFLKRQADRVRRVIYKLKQIAKKILKKILRRG